MLLGVEVDHDVVVVLRLLLRVAQGVWGGGGEGVGVGVGFNRLLLARVAVVWIKMKPQAKFVIGWSHRAR
jgi:hypothetical protein